MPNWQELLNEVQGTASTVGSPYDIVRRKYIRRLAKLTKRNVIVYYSGWLQKIGPPWTGLPFELNDGDKNGFMAAIHRMNKKDGLDLVLHTPGGDIAATESLVDYLRSIFGIDIRAIVPQLALSAGTMMALACKSILMGKHSSIGPIDPQYAGLPAHGIIEEFNRAKAEIANDPATIPVWQSILAKYTPTLVGECAKGIAWSDDIVQQWMLSGMFLTDVDRQKKTTDIMKELATHALTLSHDRHISLDKADSMGIVVEALEDDNRLQDAVISVHHACILTLTGTSAFKIIENHRGVTVANIAQMQAVAVPTSP